MITLKSHAEIQKMRDAGRIAALAREAAGEVIKEGVTTRQIERKIREVISSHSASPSFLGYSGFPAAACVSVNDEVIHGIPGNRVVKPGDIVKIDVGVLYKGFQGDCAATFPVGEVAEEVQKLIEVTKNSFYAGIEQAYPQKRIGDIGEAIEKIVVQNGFSVVRDFVGHGIGRELHEDPSVPNYGIAGHGVKLMEGMTLAVEPMVNMGSWRVRVKKDGWTVVTQDGSLSAHYENTLAITANGPEILTLPA
ncbi:MAG: type I methionyl aminopeptidase [Eubacteriales bacterium]